MKNGTNQYLKALIISAIIVAISVISYYCIVDGYPFGSEDRTKGYYNSILILKGIITMGAILAASISSAIVLRK